MIKRAAINDFLACSKLAVVGVSRSGKKFGNNALKELRKKGYKVFPVNPNAEEIEGEKCFSSLSQLTEKVDGAVVVVSPTESEKVIREAASLGINNIWLQQGAESEGAIRFCEENKLNLVYGECILMFAEPAEFFHRAHRFVKGIIGKLPK